MKFLWTLNLLPESERMFRSAVEKSFMMALVRAVREVSLLRDWGTINILSRPDPGL